MGGDMSSSAELLAYIPGLFGTDQVRVFEGDWQMDEVCTIYRVESEGDPRVDPSVPVHLFVEGNTGAEPLFMSLTMRVSECYLLDRPGAAAPCTALFRTGRRTEFRRWRQDLLPVGPVKQYQKSSSSSAIGWNRLMRLAMASAASDVWPAHERGAGGPGGAARPGGRAVEHPLGRAGPGVGRLCLHAASHRPSDRPDLQPQGLQRLLGLCRPRPAGRAPRPAPAGPAGDRLPRRRPHPRRPRRPRPSHLHRQRTQQRWHRHRSSWPNASPTPAANPPPNTSPWPSSPSPRVRCLWVCLWSPGPTSAPTASSGRPPGRGRGWLS